MIDPKTTYTNNYSFSKPSSAWQTSLKKKTPALTTNKNSAFDQQVLQNMQKQDSGSSLYQPTANSKLTVGTTGNLATDSKNATQNQVSQNIPYSPSNTGTVGVVQPTAQQSYTDQLAGITSQAGDIQSALDQYVADQQGAGEADGGKSSAYLQYMRSLENPAEASAAQQSRDAAAQRLADIQSQREKMEFEARKAYEEALDRPGGTVAHAQQAATLSRRRTGDELANKSLEENAALRNMQVAQGVYESEEGMNRKLSLEETESLGLPFGITMNEARQMGVVPQGTDTGSPTDIGSMAQMVADGTMSIENVPSDLRGQVASEVINLGGVNPESSPYLQEIARNGLTAVDGLLAIAESSPGIFGKTAALPLPGAVRSDEFRNYEAQLDYLKGNIIPAALTAMREASKTGGALGQVSDREGAWLASSLGALSMKQSPSAIMEQLKLVQQHMQTWQTAVDQYAGESAGGEGLYDF